MDETRISMTALRQNLGDLVNRAAYGGERIVLVSRGEPRAAIIGLADLRRLEQATGARVSEERDQFGHALEAADRVRERIQRWQEAHGIEPGDSGADLRRLREARDDDILGLR